ncbi:hypothetical protein IEO21_07960 [Rhodonia placenta]|uniref:Uncharacterized protein n=1 Tax=Rhodonia placenta TaxID=104341 RepID=A0A8H7TZV4_9APHY|nr:hypothetical protein IEO21_07960 [Postia placenta]
MKRSQDLSPLVVDPGQAAMLPAQKKFKAARVSLGASIQVEDGEIGSAENGETWTKVEKRKAKKARRVEAKLDANPPRFMYAKSEIVKRREAVGINDIRDLVLHLSADAPPPSWVRVENPRSVQKVVALLVPGVTPDVISLPPLPTSATANPNLPLPIPLPPDTQEQGTSHDTAVIYHHPRGRPLKPGLAWLTKKWCGREIQNRGEGGHDPEEDARACVDLLNKKIENGPGFGEFKIDMESIFERMGRARGGSITTAVVDHGNPGAWHGSKATTVVACNTDGEVLDALLGAIPSHSFVFGRFTGLASALGWITSKGNADIIPDSQSVPEVSATGLNEAFIALDGHLKELYAALPPRTALMIFTGHSDPRRMAELNARKATFENALRQGKSLEDVGKEQWWTSADGRTLEEEVEKAKRGLLFLGIKDTA